MPLSPHRVICPRCGAGEPEMSPAPLAGLPVRDRFDPIVYGAPPHAAVLERDPNVLARMVKQGPQRVEVLCSAAFCSNLLPYQGLDRRQIGGMEKIIGDTCRDQM